MPDLLALINESNPVIKSYFEHVANGGLARYRAIRQHGQRTGQSLYDHVLSGIQVLEVLRHCLKLSDLEARLLFGAFSVHDINKVAEAAGERGSYRDLATRGRFAAELERLGMAGFFPGWRDYLADICALARDHQEHAAPMAVWIDRRDTSRFRLPIDRLKQLGKLMKAADCIDLSTDLTEQHQKEKFLSWVNEASTAGRWALTWHRLAENRGILTNVIHNALVRLLRERFDAVPLLYYPEGVVYMVPAEAKLKWEESDTLAAAQTAGRALRRLHHDDVAKFVKGTNFGIKVAPQAFDSGASLNDILEIVRIRVEKKRYPASKVGEYESKIASIDLRPKLDRLPEVGKQLAEMLLARPNSLLTRDEAELQCGELALAYKLLLAKYAESRAVKAKPWKQVYEIFGVPEPVRAVADLVDAGRRGHFLARWLDRPLDEYLERVATDAAERISVAPAGTDEGALGAYLRAYLDLPFGGGRARHLTRALIVYVQQRHRQCCHCGSLDPAGEWMAADVPSSIRVQSFSNRLPGGVLREPKRNVCAICRAQYTLEKLAWAQHSDKQGDSKRKDGWKIAGLRTFYLHLFPHAFFTEPFLASFRQVGERLLREGHVAFLVNTDAYFREQHETGLGRVPIYFEANRGVALPKLAETISNVPVLPVHAPGDSYREQFLLAVEAAVVLQRLLGCRALLSRLPVAPLQADEMAKFTLFFEGIPAVLGRLLPADGLGVDEAERLFGQLRALHQAREELVPGDTNPPPIVLDLACAGADDPLRVYQVADRLIERYQRNVKSGNSTWAGVRVAQKLGPLLERLATGVRRN